MRGENKWIEVPLAYAAAGAPIEDVGGSFFGDTIIGDAGPNALRGDVGADTIAGGGGDDILIGG